MLAGEKRREGAQWRLLTADQLGRRGLAAVRLDAGCQGSASHRSLNSEPYVESKDNAILGKTVTDKMKRENGR